MCWLVVLKSYYTFSRCNARAFALVNSKRYMHLSLTNNGTLFLRGSVTSILTQTRKISNKLITRNFAMNKISKFSSKSFNHNLKSIRETMDFDSHAKFCQRNHKRLCETIVKSGHNTFTTKILEASFHHLSSFPEA